MILSKEVGKLRTFYYSKKAEANLQKVFKVYRDKYVPMKVRINGEWKAFMFSTPKDVRTDGLFMARMQWDDLECLGDAIANGENIQIDRIEDLK
jgi:hypothetical protein